VRRGWILGLAAGAVLLAGCTERAITGTEPDSIPGQGASTVEVVLPASSITTWRDTTFTGFAQADEATFTLLGHEGTFRSRPLGRFGTLPDSIDLDGQSWAVDSFTEAELLVITDTLDIFITAGGTDIDVHALQRSYDPATATWEQAADGQPWDSAGGDLGPVVASGHIDPLPRDSAVVDTVSLAFGADVDSVLKAWRASDGEPGFALTFASNGSRLRISQMSLHAKVRLIRPDSTLDADEIFAVAGGTFIFTPPLPPPGTSLRVGGIPANRAYVEFTPPDSADGHRLRGAQISRAELVFRPLAPPAENQDMEIATSALLTGLGADFFQLGPKTPVAGLPGTSSGSNTSSFTIFPDSLRAGRPLILDVTGVVRSWASTPEDSTPDPIRLAVRLQPDGQAQGYWDFGSAEADSLLQPVFRILVTPRVPFEAP